MAWQPAEWCHSRPATIPVAIAPASTKSAKPGWFLASVGIAVGLSTFVMTEPALIDLAIAVLVLWGLLSNNLSFRSAHGTPALIVAAFTVAQLISLWAPLDLTRGVWFLGVTLYLTLSMLFFTGVTSRFGLRAVQVIAVGYGISGVVAVLLGAFGYYVHGPWQTTLLLYGRPKGLFKDPNVFGPYLVPMVVYALSRLISYRRQRLLCAAVLLISAFGVLISFSRAAWLNCALSVAAYVPLRLISLRSPTERKDLLKKAAGPALLLMAAALVVASLPGIQDMITVRIGTNGFHSYDSERFAAHAEAFRTALSHPLGIGPGQWEFWYYMSVHSTFYRVLSENGFAALGILVFFLVASVYRSIRLALTSPSDSWRNLYAVVAACVLGLILNSAVVDTLHWRHLWLLLGVVWTSRPIVAQAPRRRTSVTPEQVSSTLKFGQVLDTRPQWSDSKRIHARGSSLSAI
ncbi:MAG: putative transrane protein [Bryobacterales bacterium]|nr:putative transrane protein [Bryobacterales bacterium]